jgi:ligand-binding sensor domain-containing protein
MGKALTRALISLASLLACGVCALALDPSLDVSQYAHTSWKISEGFGRGDIWALDQTPDGYLWLATEFGLRRFDGVRTVEWQPPAGEHLPSSDIRSLIAARDGTLWIGTAKELVSWKAGKLTHYPEFDKHDVHSLLEDREGTVWAAGTIWAAGPSTPGKLCAINRGGVHCFGSDGRFGGFGVTALYEDSRGNLWLGAANGLWRWKPGPPERFPVPELEHYGAGLIFPRRALLEDSQRALLITGPRGIRRFIDGKFSPYPLPSGAPQFKEGKLLRDRDGGLWIGTSDAGLLHMHQGRMDVFAQPDGLSSNVVQNLFEDREGNIWIATNNGLDRFRDYAVPSISVKQGLPTPFVTSVVASKDGSVWLGSLDGLNRWRDGQITVYRSRAAGIEASHSAGSSDAGAKSHQKPDGSVHELTASGLPDNYVGSLYQEPQGRIWISTARGLAYFEHGKFTSLSGVHLREWFLSPVARDSAGNLWMTSDQGLYRLSGGRVAEYWPSTKLGLRGALSTLLVTDPIHGGLWVASWEGGVVYFKDGRVRASYGPADGLGEDSVSNLELDSEDTLWAATNGGLSRIKNGHVATLTTKNGLPCDRVYGIAQDDARSFWMYTACGLVRISRPELDAWVADPKRQIQATVLDTSDGVKTHAGVLQYAPRMTKAADGKVWFVPFDGVSFVDPRHLPFNKLPPPVLVEQVTAGGKLRWRNLSGAAASNLRLPALSRDLEIDYTALSLVAPEKVHFKYKLEGYDSGWQYAGNRRQAFYTNLSPRNYRFRVTACNNSGVWNGTGDTLDFSIAPAYYQTPWFLAACVAAFLGVLWGLYWYRLHQIAQEFHLRLEERVNERTRIARDLHDTLLQSFQGLMLHFQVAVDRLPWGEAKEALEKALEQGDQAIMEGREAIHDLRASTVVTNDLPQAVQALGDELTSQDSAAFRLVVEGAPRNLNPILRDEIYRIAREAVRNAFRHAQARRIEAEIMYGERQFRVRIRDDGRGIDPAVAGEGRAGHYGLPGMRERAKRIGAELSVWSGIGAGTEIGLDVPGAIAYGTAPTRGGWWWHKLEEL